MVDRATGSATRPVRRATSRPPIVLVTGMSGAGKSSVLKALEDLGYEAVDNLPIALLTKLLRTSGEADFDPMRPLAIGIDSRTRGFNAGQVVKAIQDLRTIQKLSITLLFLDCSGEELARRFSETRRRHPLAQDRPVIDGIVREREMLAPLRLFADSLLDTTDHTIHKLRAFVTDTFGLTRSAGMTVTLMSFGFARGVPRDVDLLFDLRFLRNPHWDDRLRPKTGLDREVGDYIRTDPGYTEAFDRLLALLIFLLPRYRQEGKSYLTIGFGCTGGRHRSVFMTEEMAAALRKEDVPLTILHRDLGVVAASGEPRGGEQQPS